MHKKFSALLLLLFVFSLLGTVAAQERAKINMVSGVVKTVDAKNKTVIIRVDRQTDFTFSFADKTVLRSNNGQKISFNDITIDTVLVLTYDIIDGKNVANSITSAGKMVPGPSGKKS